MTHSISHTEPLLPVPTPVPVTARAKVLPLPYRPAQSSSIPEYIPGVTCGGYDSKVGCATCPCQC